MEATTELTAAAGFEAAALAEALASSKGTNEVIREEGLSAFMIVNTERHKLVGLENFLKEPSRVRMTVDVDTAESFAAYVNEHKEDRSRVFAEIDVAKPEASNGRRLTPLTLRAVLDYPAPGKPSWATHTVCLKPEASPEFSAWLAKDEASFDQESFALFLEEHQPEIIRPSGAEVLEIATTIEASAAVEFRSSVRLENGSRKFLMDSETAAKAGLNGTLEVPSEFTIRLPVFEAGEPREITARLRHRLNANTGALTFHYKLVRPRDILREAAEEVIGAVRAATNVPIYRGGYSRNERA